MNLFVSFKYLLALDEQRHFGRAALACHVTQPALSNALRALEEGLGVAIVNPVTALAAASAQLVLRRLAFSIPFSVTALLPLYRPPLPEVAPMLDALRSEAAGIARRLHALA